MFSSHHLAHHDFIFLVDLPFISSFSSLLSKHLGAELKSLNDILFIVIHVLVLRFKKMCEQKGQCRGEQRQKIIKV